LSSIADEPVGGVRVRVNVRSVMGRVRVKSVRVRLRINP